MGNKDLFFSVILPVFNNADGLDRTLDAIFKQDISENRYEVIVVDNGSHDQPERIAKKYKCTFLKEEKYLGSPYSARNRGLEIAKGDVIVLLDTTCAPVVGWLNAALACFYDAEADLIGGAVTFDISKNSSLGEKYDSLTNIRMEESIKRRAVAKTTNLFIRKEVFENIGLFPEGLRSGGDVAFTKKATQSGFRLVFCKGADAIMTPRGFRPLIKKQLRVAKGQLSIWKQEGSFKSNFVKRVLLCWIPPSPFFLIRSIQNSGNKFLYKDIIGLLIIGHILRVVTAYGILTTMFKRKKESKNVM